MFPAGRFETETPNVIDPGEMPPSRPSRIQSKRGQGFTRTSSVSSASSSADSAAGVGRVYKTPLCRGTIKLALDADDEPDEPDDLVDITNDPEFGIHKSSQAPTRPSSAANPILSPAAMKHEQARLFAEALLNESSKREYRRNEQCRSGLMRGISQSRMMKGMHDSIRSLSLPDREDLEMRRAVGLHDDPLLKLRQQTTRKRMCHRILVLLGVVGILSAFGLALFKGLQSRVVSLPMSDRLAKTIDLLAENNISKKEDLLSVSSPQFQAAYWLANTDEESIYIPTSSDDQNLFRFVQRYVLAVFYYALDGNNWINALSFTSADHECSWSENVLDVNGEPYAVGVTCHEENMHVRGLLIRKYTIADLWKIP